MSGAIESNNKSFFAAGSYKDGQYQDDWQKHKRTFFEQNLAQRKATALTDLGELEITSTEFKVHEPIVFLSKFYTQTKEVLIKGPENKAWKLSRILNYTRTGEQPACLDDQNIEPYLLQRGDWDGPGRNFIAEPGFVPLTLQEEDMAAAKYSAYKDFLDKVGD